MTDEPPMSSDGETESDRAKREEARKSQGLVTRTILIMMMTGTLAFLVTVTWLFCQLAWWYPIVFDAFGGD